MFEITWMVDSAGIETAHRNGAGLNQKDSYLGTLFFNRTEQNWYAIVGGTYGGNDGEKLGPFGSNQNSARIALVGGIREKNQ
jgi:hypothetical protein